jgi:hypothetical protein
VRRLVIAIALLEGRAFGDAGLDQDRARDLVPDPAGPVFELSWREGLRGEAGARIPVLRRDDRMGFELDVVAFIELHNNGPGIVPYELWRGHIGVVGAERWLAGRWTLRAYGALEHESDHDIDHHWIYWEAIGVGIDATHESERLRLTFGGQARVLFETCTISIDCTTHLPLGTGDTSLEGIVSVAAELDPRDRGHWFAALYADATIARPLIAGDVRALVHLGYVLATRSRGVWQLFGMVLGGPEVGLDRVLGNQLRFGVGFRWQP